MTRVTWERAERTEYTVSRWFDEDGELRWFVWLDGEEIGRHDTRAEAVASCKQLQADSDAEADEADRDAEAEAIRDAVTDLLGEMSLDGLRRLGAFLGL